MDDHDRVSDRFHLLWVNKSTNPTNVEQRTEAERDYSYDQGVFSGIVGNSDWLDTFGHPSSGLEGIIVSIYNLGAFSGCILTFIFAEKFGRRLCMWIAMGWIVRSVAANHDLKIRFLIST